MKKLSAVLLLSSALTLAACDKMGEQWLNPDASFASLDQPKVKGINETQEEMAKEATEAGDYGRAAQFYQLLVASGKGTPDDVRRYKFGMADSTRRLGQGEAALAMFEELYRDYPNDIDIMEGRALTLMATGKTADAGRAFEQVMEKDKKRWRTLNALGILFVTKNMVPEAMAYYEEALNNSPDNAAILNNVGLSYATDRNFSRAIEALQHASRVSKSPSQRKQIELNLAMVQGVSGNMDAARETASKYMEGPALDNNLGLYAHLAKDDNLAKTYLNMALSSSSIFYERAWENLGVVSNSNREGDALAPAPKASKKTVLPKTPAAKPVSNKKSRRGAKGKKIVEEAKQEVAPAEPAKPEEPRKLPEVEVNDKKALKAEDKPTLPSDNKPAAPAAVAPSEGD